MRIEDEKFLAALVLALGVVVVFQFEGFSGWFTPFLLPSLFCVMVFSLLPYVNYSKDLFTKIHPAVLPLVALQQLVLPGIAAIGGSMLNVDPQILFFIMVTLTSGSLFASPTLVHLMGLDQKLAVQTVVLSTLMAPISISVGFNLLHDSHFAFDLNNFAARLFFLMIIPLCIFAAIHRWARNWTPSGRERSILVGRWGAVLSLVVFCFALEAPVVAALKNDSQIVLYYLVVSTVSMLTVALVLRFALARMGYSTAMTASVLGGFRNIGLTFGLVGYAGDSNLAVYVGASQIPMFFAPLLFEIFFGRRVREHNEEDLSKELEAEEFTTNQGRLSASMPKMHNAPTSSDIAASARSSTTVAVSQGMAVGAANMSVAAEELNELDQPMFEPEADLAKEDARDLQSRLEDNYEPDAASKSAPSWPAGRFVVLTLVLFIAGVAAIWQGNKYFAPMLFDNTMISEVAQTHVEGKNYGVFDLNINIRDLRNETIKRMKGTPEVGILGASHWQEAHVDSVPGLNFYNSHIHRDYYEDMMAMIEIYERHNKLPKNLIITIRDKLLTPVKDRTDFLWLPGIKYYRDFAKRTGYPAHSVLETLPVQTWRELANFSLLKTHGMRHMTAPVMPHATEERSFEGLDVLLPGGSILWSGEHKRLFSQERARNEALSFASASKKTPPKIDPKGVAHMEFLFQYLKDKGVNVALTHPQFNPIFWDEVQGTEYMVGLKKIEDLTKSWAKKYGFGLFGGFAPHEVGCKAKQYIDAEHGDSACLAKLLTQYRTYKNLYPLRGAL